MNYRRIISTVLLITSCVAWAQHTPLDKYSIPHPDFEEVFLDHVENYSCRLVGNTSNQYHGQTNAIGIIYGYGMFISKDGSQIYGKFRNGLPICSITIGQNSAIVGSQEHFVSYSLSTGQIEFIHKNKEKLTPDATQKQDHAFVSMRYQNGDQYVGEIYQGKRHGFGIYYYSNGDAWFGEYNNDIRSGYGCLFRSDEGLEIGHWEGEDTRRLIYIHESAN